MDRELEDKATEFVRGIVERGGNLPGNYGIWTQVNVDTDGKINYTFDWYWKPLETIPGAVVGNQSNGR